MRKASNRLFGTDLWCVLKYLTFRPATKTEAPWCVICILLFLHVSTFLNKLNVHIFSYSLANILTPSGGLVSIQPKTLDYIKSIKLTKCYWLMLMKSTSVDPVLRLKPCVSCWKTGQAKNWTRRRQPVPAVRNSAGSWLRSCWDLLAHDVTRSLHNLRSGYK